MPRNPSGPMSKPSHTANADQKRLRLLLALLPHIAFDGWTAAAYAAACKDTGISAGEAGLLCPQGIRDLIDMFGVWADDEMQRRIEAEPGFARRRTRDKIAFAVRARLESLTPHREAMRRLLVWYALPTHLPLAARRLYRTVDLVWRAAGDTATDFNFYTKRGLLSAVFKTTTLFWLDDQSPKQADTWNFLDRRIAEVLKLGKTISLAREWSPREMVDILRKKFSWA